MQAYAPAHTVSIKCLDQYTEQLQLIFKQKSQVDLASSLFLEPFIFKSLFSFLGSYEQISDR